MTWRIIPILHPPLGNTRDLKTFIQLKYMGSPPDQKSTLQERGGLLIRYTFNIGHYVSKTKHGLYRLLKYTWWLMFVRLYNMRVSESFGVIIFAEKHHWRHADSPTSWSDCTVRTCYSQLHWYMASHADIFISPWETYITSFTNTCMFRHSKTTQVPLNLVSGTYTNSYILFYWNMEDESTFPFC